MRAKKGSPKPKLTRRRVLKRAAFGICAGGFGISAGGSQFLAVNRLKVPLAGLGPCFEGFRVAFASDFHLGPQFPVGKLRSAVKTLAGLNADVILLGGDYVTHSAARIPDAIKELSALTAPEGVWAVPGNHEYWTGPISDYTAALASSPIGDLNNRGIAVRREGEALWLAGLDDLWCGNPRHEDAMRNAPPGAPTVVVCHNPDTALELPEATADLILAGHTHGWQVYVPLLTRCFVPDNLRNFRAGFYRTAAGLMYVTRGVGLVSPSFRLWCRPEIALIELTRAETPEVMQPAGRPAGAACGRRGCGNPACCRLCKSRCAAFAGA